MELSYGGSNQEPATSRTAEEAIGGAGRKPDCDSFAEGGGTASCYACDRPIHSNVSGGSLSRGKASGRVSVAGADGDREDQNRGGSGGNPAWQRKESSEGGLRRVPDGARGSQADWGAARISGTSRNAAHADSAEAQRCHQRPLRALAGVVR